MYFSVNEIILNPGGFMFKRMIGLLLYISLFVFTVGILIQNIPPKTYITVQFEEARPIRHRMSVYYKGFRIGRTIRMRPSKDYRTTLLTVALNPQDLNLPINVTARLNREKKRWREHDFIEIIYPDSPSLYYLKDGDVIKGNTVVDLDSFIAATADSGYLDKLKDNLNDTVKSANETLETLNGLFIVLKDTIEEARPNIIAASQNLSNTTRNLYNVSNSLNTSLNEQRLNNVGENLNGTTKNLNETIGNIEEITGGLKDSVPQMTSIIDNIDGTTCNLNVITSGISATLQKRLGLFRLLFGKPVNCK